tara:strand:+ start:960 stop:1169 length:210 start_codon:yes stop_codon:yes gene_type:complete
MKEKIQRIADKISEWPDEDEDIAQNVLDAYRLVNRLLDPEGFGFAVSAEVRDAARVVLGIKPVEQNLYR